jgi:hypothetical protein
LDVEQPTLRLILGFDAPRQIFRAIRRDPAAQLSRDAGLPDELAGKSDGGEG